MKGQALESNTPVKGVETAEKQVGEASTAIVQEKDSQAGKELHTTTSAATKDFTEKTFGSADSILDMGESGAQTAGSPESKGLSDTPTGKGSDVTGDSKSNLPESKGLSDLQDGKGADAAEKSASGIQDAKKIENQEMKPAGESGNNEADAERDGSQAEGNPRRDGDSAADSANTSKPAADGSKTGAFGEKTTGEVDEQDHSANPSADKEMQEMAKEAAGNSGEASDLSGINPSGKGESNSKVERPGDSDSNKDGLENKEPFHPEDFKGMTPKDAEKAEPHKSQGLEGTSPKDFEQKLRFDPKELPLN